jgi:hypothetical protein
LRLSIPSLVLAEDGLLRIAILYVADCEVGSLGPIFPGSEGSSQTQGQSQQPCWIFFTAANKGIFSHMERVALRAETSSFKLFCKMPLYTWRISAMSFTRGKRNPSLTLTVFHTNIGALKNRECKRDRRSPLLVLIPSKLASEQGNPRCSCPRPPSRRRDFEPSDREEFQFGLLPSLQRKFGARFWSTRLQGTNPLGPGEAKSGNTLLESSGRGRLFRLCL